MTRRLRRSARGWNWPASALTTCGYARQHKLWVQTDPDRVLWEIYTKHEDLDHSGFEDAPRAASGSSQRVWQHRITDPLPPRIPYGVATLDEVMLEGTFNASVTPRQLDQVLAEAFRVLKPGGRIAVHVLVGNGDGFVSTAEFPGTPQMFSDLDRNRDNRIGSEEAHALVAAEALAEERLASELRAYTVAEPAVYPTVSIG